MSELINTHNRETRIRRQLMATVSALALFALVYETGDAKAADGDGDHPVFWIELGGQIERNGNAPDLFSPAFFGQESPTDFAVEGDAQKPPPYSTGFDGKISFTPEDSDWVFSGAIRFGKSGTTKHLHHQSAGPASAYDTVAANHKYTRLPFAAYADTHSSYRESHAILDFEAGKDLGLGMFGTRGSSVVSAGVRFAQFAAASHVTIHALPAYHVYAVKYDPGVAVIRKGERYHYTAKVQSSRDAHAIGPSLSWDASLPVAGNDSGMTLNVDWGINGAVLFGRQRASVRHQTQGCYAKGFPSHYTCLRSYANPPVDKTRSRTVMIPNLGGTAAISLKFPVAKISLGYRADFFFNAMDGGIDTRESKMLGFYGPFASVSIGIGG
jgi:hypothetical protein